MRAVYRARHERVVDALTEQFATHLKVIPSAVGLHLAAIAPGASSQELDGLLRRASAAGVELLPLSLYAVDTPPQPGLVFAYGAIPTSRIGEGMARLRRCFDN
jgi:GntR family transcriptional regulator / MocR family aminotransferase